MANGRAATAAEAPFAPARFRGRAADALLWGAFSFWFLAMFTQGVPAFGGASWNILGTLAMWAGAAGAWALRLHPETRPAFGVPKSAFGALLALGLGWWLFSALAGEVRSEAIRSARSLLIYVSATLPVAAYAARHGQEKTLGRIVAWLTGLCALVAVAEFALKRDLLVPGVDTSGGVYFRVNALSPNPIVLGFHMTFGLPFAMWLSAAEKKPLPGWGAMACAGLIALAGLLTLNRQTMAIMVFTLGLGLCLLRGRRLAWMALAGLLGAALIAPKAAPLIASRFASLGEIGKDTSFKFRRDSFLTAREAWRQHAWTGIGLGQFPLNWHRYPAEGTFYIQYNRPDIYRWYIDAGYTQALAETGLPGLALFAALWACASFQSLWLCLRERTRGDPESANWQACLFLLASSMALASLMQDTLLRPRVWLCWALAAFALEGSRRSRGAPGARPLARTSAPATRLCPSRARR